MCLYIAMVNHAMSPVRTDLHVGLDSSHCSELSIADAFFYKQFGFSSIPTGRDLDGHNYSNRILGLSRIGNEVIGGVYGMVFSATSMSESTVDILYLAVQKKYRNRGLVVGSYLLGLLEEAAIKKGACIAQLTSLEGALGFWEKQNYRPTNKDERYNLFKCL